MAMTYATVTGRVVMPGTATGVPGEIQATPLTQGEVLSFPTEDYTTIGPAVADVAGDGSIAQDGTPGLKIPTDTSAVLWRLRFHPKGKGNLPVHLGDYEITASTDLADLVPIDPIVIDPTLVPQIEAAAALGATNDTATASFVDDSGSATSAALAGAYDRKTKLVVGSSKADYASLADALAVAVSGDELFLRAQTHTLPAGVTVPAGVTIRASKVGATLEGSFNSAVTAVTLNAGASIRGVTLRNTHATGSGGVSVAVSTNSGSDVSVRDCRFTGTWTQGVLAYFGSDVSVRDCTFDAMGQAGGSSTPGDGINIYGTDGALVRGCMFKNLRQDAVYVGASAKSVTVTGNTIRRCPEGVQVRVGCESVTITNNTFDIMGSSVVTSFGVILQTDSIDCVVSGNTFRTTAGTAAPAHAVSVDSRSHRAVITGNTIKGLFANGISIQTTGAAGSESLGCVIANNTLVSISTFSILVGANESGAVVSGNRVTGGGSKAILVKANRCSVVGNTVNGNAGFDGITIEGSFNAVTGNHVSDVGANAGILLTGTDNTVTGNTCHSNNTYGINDLGDRNVIVGNNCQGNDHATWDINSTGAASKVAYNVGRYTAKGAP